MLTCATYFDADTQDEAEVRRMADELYGRADWNFLVTITYRDWGAIQEHSDREIAERLYPDQMTFAAEEAHRFSLLDAHWDVALEERVLPR